MSDQTASHKWETLYSPLKIGNKSAANRFVVQAMEGNDGAEGGAVSDRTLDRYVKLAKGKWGAVVVEAISVDPRSRARVNGLVLNKKNLDSFKRLVDSYKKENPDGVLLFQLTHSGRKSGPFSRQVALYEEGRGNAHLLNEQEVEDIRQMMIEASHLSKEVGADGIDFKMCHGYFGAEMLRPANVREDKWGGSFENRTRFLLSSLRELKSSIGQDGFILGSRISMFEGVRGGCGTAKADSLIEDLTEMKQVISLMAAEGADYLNVSAGIPGVTSEVTRPTNPSKYFYLHHFRYCKEAREFAGDMKIIGSAYSILREESLDYAEENLNKGFVDMIGFGRQSFADPLFPAKVMHGEPVNYCTACSACTKLMVNQLHDGCVVYDPYYRDVLKQLRTKA
jgi:2,4-dienoyl-CoA reductase-like NADH-dependent reductase (Old Yellow Enzyme family)